MPFDLSSARVVDEEEDRIPLEGEVGPAIRPAFDLGSARVTGDDNAEAPSFDLASAKVSDAPAFDISSAKVSPLLSQRDEIMSELDDNPFTKRLTMQMLDTEGGGTATMEALVNRVAMIRQKVPGWKISEELTSGFYGPINTGYAQTRELHPGTIAKYQKHIDEVRSGSNVIQGRTDQGYINDANARGPGRVMIPDNPTEVYNYWTGRRRGVDFSHEDSAKFAMNLQGEGPNLAPSDDDGLLGFKIREDLTPEEKSYFEAHPEVSGMPASDGTIILNQMHAPPGVNMEDVARSVATQLQQQKGGKAQLPAQKAARPLYTVGPKPKGMVEQGNIDLSNRPIIKNPDGTISSERSFSIEENGKEVLIPLIVNGKELSQQEAIDHYRKTGEHMGKFKDVASADAYAEVAHNRPMPTQASTTIEPAASKEVPAKKEVGAIESAKRSLESSSLGIGEAVNRYAYSPVIHGVSEAIQAVAPESELAKKAKAFDDEFFKHTVEEPAAMRKKLEFAPETEKRTLFGKDIGKTSEVAGELAEMGGALVPDIATAALTQGATAAKAIPAALKTAAPTIMNAIKSYAPQLVIGARSFIVPAMKSGMDASKQVKEQGGSEADQNAAFLTNTLKTMAMAAVPMAAESRLATLPARIVSRGAQGGALAGATGELERTGSNIVLGENRPFSPVESFKQVVTGGVLGPVFGRKGEPASKLQQAKAAPAQVEGGYPTLPAPGTVGMPAREVGPTAGPRTPGQEPPLVTPLPEPRIKPAFGFTKKIVGEEVKIKGIEADPGRTLQGTAEIMEKGGFTALGQAIRDHIDRWRVYTGMTHAPIRKWAKGMNKEAMAKAHEEFKNYWRSVDERWAFISEAMLQERQARPMLEGPRPQQEGISRAAQWVNQEDMPAGITPDEILGTRTHPQTGQKEYFIKAKGQGGLKRQVESAENELSAMAGMGGDFIKLLRAKRTEHGWDDTTYVHRMRQAIDRLTGATTTPRVPLPGIPAPAAAAPAFGETSSPSQSIYDAAGAKGKEIIDISRRLFSETGDIALKNGLEVFNHETSKWRPFRKIGEGRFFPRRISEKWHEILSKPTQYPEQFADISREAAAKGYVNQPEEFKAYVSRVLGTHTPEDLSPIEHARTSPLPTRVYDYGFDQMVNYLNNWSWDMARIEAFGQKSRGQLDLFEKSEQLTTDTYSKGYIKDVQNIAYRKQNSGAWSAYLNGAQTVSTIGMLVNYLSSMRNALGGILYNATYNGISNTAKALARIHEMAAHFDDAYERGILQDNLFNVQEDVSNLKSPIQKALEKGFRYSGQQLAEEVTRTMNLMAARDFLRNAVAQNQIDPASPKMIQIRARLQRLGPGINTEALLREGGQNGPLTDRFLRQNVATVQGGYQYDMTPRTLNTPGGRLIFQFQKWGTQAADIFVKNVANPAVQAISGGQVGKKETVQVPDGRGGMRAVKVPGDIMPAVRFLLLSTAAGLTQKELQQFIFGIEDKEASFAEIVSRLEKGDAKAFGDLISKVWMANMSVGAAGVIGNYTQLLTDMDKRTRFKDPSSPPALVLPKLLVSAFVDWATQGKLTGRDWDAYARNAFSAYRTVQGIGSQLNDAFGGNIIALKAVSNRNDIAFLRSRTRRYDNVIGVGAPAMGGAPPTKTSLTPFNADLKEALMMGDSLRAANLLAEHFAGVPKSAQKEEMKRIKASVRGSQPIRAGGGSGEAMAANFLEWAGENLPTTEVMRIIDIDNRYHSTAMGLRLMDPRDATAKERREAIQKIENRRAFRK